MSSSRNFLWLLIRFSTLSLCEKPYVWCYPDEDDVLYRVSSVFVIFILNFYINVNNEESPLFKALKLDVKKASCVIGVLLDTVSLSLYLQGEIFES